MKQVNANQTQQIFQQDVLKVWGGGGVQLFFMYLWVVLTFGKYAPIRGQMATQSNFIDLI